MKKNYIECSEVTRIKKELKKFLKGELKSEVLSDEYTSSMYEIWKIGFNDGFKMAINNIDKKFKLGVFNE